MSLARPHDPCDRFATMRWWAMIFGVLSSAIACERLPRAVARNVAREPSPSYVVVRPPDPPTLIEAAPFSTCVPTLASGQHEIEHRGTTRSFVLDVPEGFGLRPLVLAFHGWGGDPDQLEGTTRIATAALKRGWVVARPIGFNKSFDAGACCGLAAESKVDDVGLAREIVAALARAACVDPARVYATGFSNGGFLAHRLGCEASDVFTAVASVAGTLGIERCEPKRAVSVLQIHGKADGIVPFAGNSSKKWSSVAFTVDTWTRALGCAAGAAEEVYARGAAKCVRNSACTDDVEVTLCRDEKAAHTWPGGPKSFGYGGSQDLDATETILGFFERHAR
ncbi:MAG: prolyl oligopeptidase family serine peptidase [Deltaproteobacteria bacterium]|nr:prolyl oligopeptidase family serine peptidase [Deltaproteobacteria bacterium]